MVLVKFFSHLLEELPCVYQELAYIDQDQHTLCHHAIRWMI
jgi:hypothetical protein